MSFDLFQPDPDAEVPRDAREAVIERATKKSRLRRGGRFGIAALVALLAGVTALVVGSEGAVVTSDDPPSPTTTAPAPLDLSSAVWPDGRSTFGDPVDAVRSFATDLVRFEAPIIGEYVATANDGGTVAIQARASGPVTTATVRQLGNNGEWWVIGATTPTIALTAPAPGDELRSPVRGIRGDLVGDSVAFTEVHEDGRDRPLWDSSVHEWAEPADDALMPNRHLMAPASKEFGALILRDTVSVQDRRVEAATVVRIRLVPPGPTTRALTMDNDGIDGIPFGTSDDVAIDKLTELLGPPTKDELHRNKGIELGYGDETTSIRFVSFGPLGVTFIDLPTHGATGMHLVSWGISERTGPNQTALTTTEGISVGSTLAEVRAAYDTFMFAAPEGCTGYPSFFTGPYTLVNGQFDREDQDPASVVIGLGAGISSSC